MLSTGRRPRDDLLRKCGGRGILALCGVLLIVKETTGLLLVEERDSFVTIWRQDMKHFV